MLARESEFATIPLGPSELEVLVSGTTALAVDRGNPCTRSKELEVLQHAQPKGFPRPGAPRRHRRTLSEDIKHPLELRELPDGATRWVFNHDLHKAHSSQSHQESCGGS